jgi:hypothetical protein
MRRIRYSGGAFLTADEAADVLCDYAAALANAGRAAALRVPALDEAGRGELVEVVVGPASQILSEVAFDAPAAAPEVAEFVRDVRADIARLGWRPQPSADLIDTWDL